MICGVCFASISDQSPRTYVSRCGLPNRRDNLPLEAMFRSSTLLHCVILILACWSVERRPRFDPPFQNEIHPPRREDAEIVRIMSSSKFSEGGKLRLFGLVHGHFLGNGQDTVVVSAQRRVDSGFSPLTFLFFKGANGWRFQSQDYLEVVAYCRVLPVSADKDVLICQSDVVGPTGRYGDGEILTNLYTFDFTRDPSASYFLHLEDTVATGRQCLAWASVKSLDIRPSTVRVVVEYGRKQLAPDENTQREFRLRATQSYGSPSGFPTRLFNLDFRFAEGSVVPVPSSVVDYKYVTERWPEDKAGTCSASTGPEPR
jgi:hypothetical protein